MGYEPEMRGYVETDIDLAEVVGIVWAGKWFIGGLAGICAVIAAVVALSLPNIYRSEVLLAPNHEDRAGGLGLLATKYSGLASLAGIDLGGGPSEKTALAIEVFRSRKFVSDFIENQHALVPLFATVGWDDATGELVLDKDIYDPDTATWVRKARFPRTSIPSPQEAYEEFRKIAEITEDPDTGFVSVSVEHMSPIVARDWAELLVENLNRTILEQDVGDAKAAIEYLRSQIEETSLAELRAVFFRLIEEQMKTVMLANATSEYVFRTIDPAIVPELKVRPRRVWIVISGFIAGMFLGILIWIGHAGFRRKTVAT